jgi:biotin operon repressor
MPRPAQLLGDALARCAAGRDRPRPKWRTTDCGALPRRPVGPTPETRERLPISASGLFDKSFNIVVAKCYASRMRRRPPRAIDLSPEDTGHLELLLRDGRTEQRVARRARILLAMADPATVVQDLADRLDVERTTIWHLCRRYEEAGVQVVGDAPRDGRPRTFSPSAARRHRDACLLRPARGGPAHDPLVDP